MSKVTCRGNACLPPSWKSAIYPFRSLTVFGVAFLTVMWIGLPKSNVQHSDQSASQTTEQVNTAALLDLLGQTYLTLESNHYAPPTGQQFALVAARVIREQSGRPIDRSMKAKVEELVTADDLRKWLTMEIEWVKQNNGELNPELIVNLTVQSFDPGAMVVSSKEARVRDQLRDNRYVGIGIRVRFDKGFAIIDEPFPGGAAKKAGAKPGDIILEVNEESMEGRDLANVVDILRGDVNTAVSVVVRNENETESRRLDMIRTVIPIPSVEGVSQNDDGSWEFVDPAEGKTARLKLSGIVGSTANELANAARKIRMAGVKNIVLDLREVTEADVHHAQIVADSLTGAGLFATVIDGDGRSQKLITRAECDFEGFRIAVMVPEKVSGPVMAVICRLNSSPNMITVGTYVGSDLKVASAFDFPDGSGSISGVNFARIDPKSLGMTGSLESGSTTIMGRTLMSNSPAVVLNAGIAVKDPATAPVSALTWLERDDE